MLRLTTAPLVNFAEPQMDVEVEESKEYKWAMISTMAVIKATRDCDVRRLLKHHFYAP